MNKQKLVIVGNGMAPGRMLEYLLEKDKEAYEVTIFNAEPRVNYNRLMLSPVLSGRKPMKTSSPMVMIGMLSMTSRSTSLHA